MDKNHCDECGRPMDKAHRVFRGHRYCTTCYAREFKRLPCPRCGKMARIPRAIEGALCRRCELDKPCIRCGKTDYAVARLTPYGPVCGTCTHYFSEPQPCALCGRLSTRLRRVPRLGIEEPVCDRCANSDHAVCQACHRYRRLYEAPDGRRLCRRCLEDGEVPCPRCGEPMPAGRGNCCETCYWTDLLERRIRLDQAALRHQAMVEAFAEFGRWLHRIVGANKAAITINRYLPFFREMDRIWGQIPAYGDLLKHFGAEGLRRVRLPMRWLREERGLVVDEALRKEDSIWRQIDGLRRRISDGAVTHELIEAFFEELVARYEAGKVKLLTVRMSLTPAVGLCLFVDPAGNAIPDQRDLDRYLGKTPGQAAALSRFVTFLNKKYQTEPIRRIDKDRLRQVRRRYLEKALIAMMKAPEETDEFVERWVALAMEYFHDTRVLPNSKIAIEREMDKLWCLYRGEVWLIPAICLRAFGGVKT